MPAERSDRGTLLHTRWQIDAHRDVGYADMTVTIGRGAQRPSRKRPVTPAPAVIAEIDHLVARHRAAMMIFATFVRIQHVDEGQHRLHLRHPSSSGLVSRLKPTMLAASTATSFRSCHWLLAPIENRQVWQPG